MFHRTIPFLAISAKHILYDRHGNSQLSRNRSINDLGFTLMVVRLGIASSFKHLSMVVRLSNWEKLSKFNTNRKKCYTPTSESDVIYVFSSSIIYVFVDFLNTIVLFWGLFAHDLVAVKSVFRKTATRDNYIVWWLYYYTYHDLQIIFSVCFQTQTDKADMLPKILWMVLSKSYC